MEGRTYEVVPVLPHDDGVLVQVGDIGPAKSLRVLLETRCGVRYDSTFEQYILRGVTYTIHPICE